MHALRLGLSGTVALTLLTALAGAALAQDAGVDTPPAHRVTGTLALGIGVEEGEVHAFEGGLSDLGELWRATVFTDDPRLTGEAWIAEDKNLYEPFPYARQLSNAIRIENDDGAWTGTMRGYFDPEAKATFFYIELTGEGAYAGHAAVLRQPGALNDYNRDIEGFVFPNPLLEFPDPVEPSVE